MGDYDYFSSYIQGDNYNFNDVVGNGIIEAKPANKTLGWGTVTITDIGLDFDVLNGKLRFTADWYNKVTDDILLGYRVPMEDGIKKDYWPSQNIGSVSNKGLK